MPSLRSLIVLGIVVASCQAIFAAKPLTLDGLFPKDRVLQVRVKISPEHWDELRYQTRDRDSMFGRDRRKAPFESPFTYFPADVEIEGVMFRQVGLRKKGFIGSLSETRPSLKVKLDFTDPDGALGGLTSLTFNNNRQDRSLVNQFLGYSLFNAAGSPAPRIAYAQVLVNGENLGVYSHVETVREPLLKREFGEPLGTLYEGTVVDFNPGWEKAFELKTGDDERGRDRIIQLSRALEMNEGTDLYPGQQRLRAWVPRSAVLGRRWTALGFDDSQWKGGAGGVGYEQNRGYERFIDGALDFGSSMRGRSASIYIRIPFHLESSRIPAGDFILRMRYDDGFVAYLNGERVAAANAPAEPGWNSTATRSHDDQAAVLFTRFNLNEHRELLRSGRNILAIHGMNASAGSSDLLLEARLRTEKGSLDETIARHVDLDAFYRFWALEGLLGFWDGYSGNRNNFFVYHNPGTQTFHFLPWGADALFSNRRYERGNDLGLLSVKLRGMVARKLYESPAGRRRYVRALKVLLDQVWKEKELLAETERLETLLRPHVCMEQRWFDEDLDSVRRFIEGRRQEVLDELDRVARGE